jgi:hypothetical protein
VQKKKKGSWTQRSKRGKEKNKQRHHKYKSDRHAVLAVTEDQQDKSQVAETKAKGLISG